MLEPIDTFWLSQFLRVAGDRPQNPMGGPLPMLSYVRVLEFGMHAYGLAAGTPELLLFADYIMVVDREYLRAARAAKAAQTETKGEGPGQGGAGQIEQHPDDDLEQRQRTRSAE